MQLLFPPALSLLLLPICLAAPLSAADEWTKVSTPNFELYTSGGEGSAKRTLLYFEQIREFFLETMNIQAKSDQPVRIIGFRNDKEFSPYRPNEFAAAYYTQSAGRDTIVLGQIGVERHETAVHEYMHLLIRNTGADFPPWLNEGFAELYSTLRPVGKQVQVGNLPIGRMIALDRLKWIPVERLLQVKHGDPEYSLKQHAGAFYAESWALVHMLNLQEELRPRIGEFLQALIETGDGAKAFKKVYKLNPDEVEKSLKSYVNQSRFMVLNYDLKLEKSAEEPVTATASDLETRLILAGLLSGQRGKAEEAAAHLQELAGDYPDAPEVAEAQGYAAWARRSTSDAVDHFARAAELGGTNPKMYRDLAALSRGSRDRAFQIKMLEKSLELDPEHQETRRILGHLYINDKQWSRGIIELNKITKVKTDEEAFALHHSRAFAYYQLKDMEQAEKLAKMARKHSDEPAKTAQLELLLEAIARGRDSEAAESVAASMIRPESFGADEEHLEPPALERRELPPDGIEVDVELIPEQPKFAGRLTQFDCLGAQARLQVESDAGLRTFALLDPMNVIIKRNGEPSVDVSFTCGPQGGKPIEITYAEPESGEGDANVIALDFLDALPRTEPQP